MHRYKLVVERSLFGTSQTANFNIDAVVERGDHESCQLHRSGDCSQFLLVHHSRDHLGVEPLLLTDPPSSLSRSSRCLRHPFMAEIHNAKTREPAILRREHHDTWLSGEPDEAFAALKQYPDELLMVYRISTRVNSPKIQ